MRASGPRPVVPGVRVPQGEGKMGRRNAAGREDWLSWLCG